MNEMILLKLGEMVLKGLNRRSFEDKLQANIYRRLNNLGQFRVYTRQSTTYVEPMTGECDMDGAWEALTKVFGVVGLSRARACEKDKDAILSAAPWVREKNMPLILQPMSSFPDLREWLGRNGFSIGEERLAREGDVLYTALLVRAGEMPTLSPGGMRAGRNTAEPLRGDWLNMWIARTSRALEGMAKAQEGEIIPRKRELEEVLNGLMDMKKEWEQWLQ